MWDGMNDIGEFSVEFARELKFDDAVVEVGEISDMHSGGLVVLRVTVGRWGYGAYPGVRVLD